MLLTIDLLFKFAEYLSLMLGFNASDVGYTPTVLSKHLG